MSHTFLHLAEIAASQQPVQPWEMIIRELTPEHDCRKARRMNEGIRLKLKPKDSTPAWN